MSTICADTEWRPAYETGQSGEGEGLRPGGLGLTARAIGYCRLSPGARVLDLGCGPGASVRYLRDAYGLKAVGLDILPSGGNANSERFPHLPIVQAQANCLPFASESMDAVLVECSLSLMADKAAVLAECFRALAAHGRLVITDMYARNPNAAGHLRALPTACASGMIVRSDLERQLANHGFQVDLWEDHSNVLKQLLFRFLMDGGHLEQLWTRKCTKKEEATRINEAMKNVRPGYFLLVAGKKPEGKRLKEGEPHE
jgi:arsenite methyltransferase